MDERVFIFVIGLFLLSGLAVGYKVSGTALSRGLKNNNPGNIKRTSDKWMGLSSIQSDPVFFVFESPEWGIRALAKLLLNYEKMGFNSVEKIISRYAPSNENDTSSYIRSVSENLEVNQSQLINVRAVLPDLIKAIIYHENGEQPYSESVIHKGIGLV